MEGIMTARPLPSFAMSTAPADIAVFSKDRRPVLVVEVKVAGCTPLPNRQRDCAAALWHTTSCPTCHFLCWPRRFKYSYGAVTRLQVLIRNYSAGAKPVLGSYGSRHANRDKPFRGGALEIVMFSWLSDLRAGHVRYRLIRTWTACCSSRGLYEQIQGGAADFEVKL